MMWMQAAETLEVRQAHTADECNTDEVELTDTLRATGTCLLDVTELVRQKAMRDAANRAKRSEKRKTPEGNRQEGDLQLSTHEKKV
jgi:hypothetical protein